MTFFVFSNHQLQIESFHGVAISAFFYRGHGLFQSNCGLMAARPKSNLVRFRRPPQGQPQPQHKEWISRQGTVALWSKSSTLDREIRGSNLGGDQYRLGLFWLNLRLLWVSKKSKDLISAVRPITLGRKRRKNFEIDTPIFSTLSVLPF